MLGVDHDRPGGGGRVDHDLVLGRLGGLVVLGVGLLGVLGEGLGLGVLGVGLGLGVLGVGLGLGVLGGGLGLGVLVDLDLGVGRVEGGSDGVLDHGHELGEHDVVDWAERYKTKTMLFKKPESK